MPDYEEIGRYVGRYGSIRLTRSELFPLLNAMHSRDCYKASCESLQAENAALSREVLAWQHERDFLRRGIFGLHFIGLIGFDKAYKLMGINSPEYAQELYDKLKPDFEANVAGAAPDTEAGGV